MEKEYVLITGITGFIGSHVANKLISENQYKIIAIVRENRRYKDIDELKQKGLIIVKGDFYNIDFIEKIFFQYPITYVMHIAALRGGGMGTIEEYFMVNVKGTELLLELSLKHKIQKFIFISSVGVFGTIPSEHPANINTKLLGDNEYHKTKILAEQKVNYYINKGLNAYIIRPTITYGPDDNGFPFTLIKLVKNRFFFLPIKDIKIHLLDVISLAELICQMIKIENTNQRIFIAADEKPVSLKALVNLIHYHFYKREYPFLLRLPNFIFFILSVVFRLTKNGKWLTSVLLISQNWYYDIKDTENVLKFSPGNTKENFIRRMGL